MYFATHREELKLEVMENIQTYQTFHSTVCCFLLTLKVVVTWPSQVKTWKLKTELEPLGKALINGTWSNIAGAVFRVKELRVELCKFFLKEIGKECCAMVSKKNLSLLRKTSATEMQSLSLVVTVGFATFLVRYVRVRYMFATNVSSSLLTLFFPNSTIL